MGLGVLKLQMDEGTGQLNQPLVKGVIRGASSLFQPEVLEHIMGLIVAPRVETFKITKVAGIKSCVFARLCELSTGKSLYKEIHAIRFFHLFFILFLSH
jgi:hypothetical protein